MKITGSDITMSSQHSYVNYQEKAESLQFWVNESPPPSNDTSEGAAVLLDISSESKSLLSEYIRSSAAVSSSNEPGDNLSYEDKFKITLIEDFFKYFLGKDIKLKVLDREKLSKLINSKPDIIVPNVSPKPQGWGLRYDFHEMRYESEMTSFNAKGIVRTQDGKEINIELNVNASREYLYQNNISLRAGDAVLHDPLVINYGGSSFSLTQRKFSFDIDCNGEADQVSFAGPGSGFLCLDKNEDGTINNGSELFGPQSNDGFKDLSAYDMDTNGWIDENDSVFNKLRIWTKDEKGNDQLLSLGQAGVGAIYLGNVNTEYTIKAGSSTDGVVRSTGIFLKEDGTPGTVQHIDIAI